MPGSLFSGSFLFKITVHVVRIVSVKVGLPAERLGVFYFHSTTQHSFMRTVRIILSPIVFLFWTLAMAVLPFGPAGLIAGPFMVLGDILSEKPIDKEAIWFTFCWVLIPWHCTRAFINNIDLN